MIALSRQQVTAPPRARPKSMRPKVLIISNLITGRSLSKPLLETSYQFKIRRQLLLKLSYNVDFSSKLPIVKKFFILNLLPFNLSHLTVAEF